MARTLLGNRRLPPVLILLFFVILDMQSGPVFVERSSRMRRRIGSIVHGTLPVAPTPSPPTFTRFGLGAPLGVPSSTLISSPWKALVCERRRQKMLRFRRSSPRRCARAERRSDLPTPVPLTLGRRTGGCTRRRGTPSSCARRPDDPPPDATSPRREPASPGVVDAVLLTA